MTTIKAEHGQSQTQVGSGVLSRPENAHKILKITADTMILLERDGRCVDMEIHTDRWFLQDASYFLGKKIFKLIPFETANALRKNFEMVLETGKQSIDNYEVYVAGKTYFFKCIMTQFDEKLILCQYRDITKRLLLKKRIEVINQRLQEVEKVAKIGQWSLNLSTRNIQFTGFSGGLAVHFETKTISIEHYFEMVHHGDRKKLKDYLSHKQSKAKEDFIDYQLNAEGERHYFRLRVINSYVTEDNDTILEGYIQNVSDIMQKQHDLEMVTLAVNNSTDYIFAIKSDGRIVFANHKFKEFHNLDSELDLSKMNFFDSITTEHFKVRWKEIIHQLLSTRETMNFVFPKPIPEKTNILAFDCTSYLVQDLHGVDQIWTFGKDITERVQYEKQVKELNQIMGTVLANIPMNIAVKDVDNDFKYIFSNRMGKPIHWGIQDDIIGKTDFELYPKKEAMELRADDLESTKTKSEVRRIIQNHDNDNKPVIFDQLRLIVEDESRSLLISIERDITKDKQMEQELINAKVKAEESDKLKSAFIANMSHEIRTPLNAIVGFSKIIAETQDPEERKSYYSIVETNNGRLLGLINEILDLSKIESGIMEFDMERFNLHALCRDVQQTLKLRCQPGVELLFETSDPSIYIHSDKNRLSQVFNNLIGNAIKFTKKGSIKFGYTLCEDKLAFYVSDTGAGIPEDKVDSVFDRFTKGDNFTQGTGLGLPICKSILEKLGGSISLKSKFGSGTQFFFSLPLSVVTHASDSRNGNGRDDVKVILVVEDNDANFVLLEKMIGSNFIIKRAKNGMDAVTMFQDLQPDLIMMDIKMPIMNGIEASKIIRSFSPTIPIIAQTAYSFDVERNAAMEAGCNAFLVKPYNKQQIQETLNKFLTIIE